MAFDLFELEEATGPRWRSDELGRRVLSTTCGELRVTQEGWTSLRTHAPDGSFRPGSAQLDTAQAAAVAAFVCSVGARPERWHTRVGARQRRKLGELPLALDDRRMLRGLRLRQAVARRLRRRRPHPDPLDPNRLRAQLRTGPEVDQSSSGGVVVRFHDAVDVALRRSADGCHVSIEAYGVKAHGLVGTDVAVALLHGADKRDRLWIGGFQRGVDFLADLAESAITRYPRDPRAVYRRIAELASPAAWDQLAGQGSDLSPTVLAAVADAAVDVALGGSPPGDIAALLGEILGEPLPVPGSPALLYPSRHGWIELRGIVGGIGLAGVGLTDVHGVAHRDMGFSGPRAVAVAGTLALTAGGRQVWGPRGGSLDVAAYAMYELRRVLEGRIDVAEAYISATDRLGAAPLTERSAQTFVERWRQVQQRLPSPHA